MTPKQNRFDYCFNPFNLEKHGKKCSKNLRRILPTMLQKLNIKNVQISTNMKICDYCRLKLSKMSENAETSDNSSVRSQDPGPSISAVLQSSSEGNLSPSQNSVDILEVNESLIELGSSPSISKKLKQRKYPRKKLERSRRTLASKVLHNEEEIEAESEDTTKCEIIEKLKEEFHSTNDRNKKIQILTIFQNWSFRKIHKNFNVSNSMIAIAKKTAEEHGILSTPNAKTGKNLSQDTVNCVVDFYTSDLASRLMAGKKNYVTVKENNQKIQKLKRLILTNLKETYWTFKEKYPDLKIGFSKFCELRPKHCVLHRASGTDSVCV